VVAIPASPFTPQEIEAAEKAISKYVAIGHPKLIDD